VTIQKHWLIAFVVNVTHISNSMLMEYRSRLSRAKCIFLAWQTTI